VLKTDDLSEIKGQFLASLNHEIRTPLSGILGMTDLLLETPLTDDQKDYVDATRVCAETLLEILNLTLEFSALSANHVSLDETEFCLPETLNGIAAEFLPKAEAKGLQFVRNFDRSLPASAVGDAVRLRQLVGHLLSNAVKFTNHGEVEFAAFASQPDGNRLALTVMVRDTGIGIASDQQRAIFEGFQQLQSGLVRNHTGLGLGLAVAQKLAGLLKGAIKVQSELGRGSTFFVDVPLRLSFETTPIAETEPKARGRILAVDDNPVAQTVASHALRRHGYEVECASDGLAAVEMASRGKFDVILLDLQMPGIDGFQTSERIRKLSGYSTVPIVAITANCSSDYRDKCFSHGMQEFLAKPVRTKDLLQVVDRYFAPKPAA